MVLTIVAADAAVVAPVVAVAQEQPARERVDVPVPESPAATPLAEQEPLPASSAFRAPTASDLGEYQQIGTVDPTPVEELVESRTANSELWRNADGTFTSQYYAEPKYFQQPDSKEWVPIDNSVVPDAEAGWFRNAGNSWTVRFGPLVSGQGGYDGGMVAEVEGQSLRTVAHGAFTGRIEPEIDAEAGEVTYRSVWPNIDLRYTVQAWGVKEDLVVNGPTDTATFDFGMDGAAIEPYQDEKSPGGEWSVGGSSSFRLAPPSVAGKDGEELTDKANPRFEVVADRAQADPAAQVMTLSVDSTWLYGLSADEYPVVIDPSFTVGADTWASYGIVSGYYCGTSCGHRTGNSMAGGDMYWRSVIHFPYESVITYGKKVVSATLNVWRNSGVTSSQPVYACWASAWSFAGACSNGYSGTTSLATSPSTIDLTNLYRQWVDNGTTGGAIGLVGNDQSGLYTFKELGANLTIVWNTPPPMPADNTSTTPANETVFSTLTPTFEMDTVTDADGDGVIYGWSIATGSDGLSGAVTSSGPVVSTTSPVSWTAPVGALRDGQTYYWRAYTYDTKNLTTSTWTRKFKIDMRLGVGGPSPMDSMGPIGVNLATGNATTSIGTPALPAVGGSAGVNLTYNSQQSPNVGLRGSYFNDNNSNKAFDDDLMFSRDDPQVNFDWYFGSPATPIGIDNFLVRWEGYINPGPSGTYNLGVSSDDGVRVYLDNSSTPVIDRWYDQGMSATPNWSGGISFTGPKRIRIDYYEGGFTAGMQLSIKESTASDGVIVPASMLTPDSPSVPSGWTMSTADAAYVSAQINDQSVLLRASDGSTYEYRKGTGAVPGWTPPAGIDDVMVTNLDGTIGVYSDSGMIYVFDNTGQLKYMTSARDDLNPAALLYTWDTLNSSSSVMRLKEITDPVSGRGLYLSYEGGTLTGTSTAMTCPTASGSSTPPEGMLCKVELWDGTATDVLYDSSGRIVRIVNPGDSTTSFVYDTNNKLTAVYDPLANDAVAATVRSDGAGYPLSTVLTYTDNMVASVTLPEPLASAARPQKTYTYGTGTTTIATAGITGTASVSFDAVNRQTGATDPTGKTTSKTWDAFDRPTSVTDAAGIRTTTIYDSHGWATDTYGPAPAASFTGLVGNTGVAHTTTAYDEGMNGLQVAWFNTSALTGTPAKHTTGLPGATGGEVNVNWGSTPPNSLPAGNFSATMTGEIILPTTGNYVFKTASRSKMRVWIDDNLVVDSWTDPGGSTVTLSADATYNATTAGAHRIRIALSDTGGQSSAGLYWTPPGGSLAIVPGANLKPRYGLPTTTTDPSGHLATASYTATNGIGPEYGLQTSGTRDPGGLDLTTTVTYEDPGAMHYLRRTSRQLPGLAPTTVGYIYYGDTEDRTNPCPSGTSANQAGRLKLTTDADPDGAGSQQALQHEAIYDAAGRVVAARVGAGTAGSWACTTYDSRGRTATVDYPSYGVDTTGRTVTYDYAVGGNPFVSSVTDPAGTVSSTVDLLGRVVSYTDVWGKTTTTDYDQAGRVETATTAGVPATSYTYDAAGRIETMSIGGAVVADPSYDTAGRMGSVTYPSAPGATIARVNVGGATITSTPDWTEDTSGSPSPYLATSGNTYSVGSTIDVTDPSLPAGTPAAMFQSERYDPGGGTEMEWAFPVTPGDYEVRLYFAETYHTAAGQRRFDVDIEGTQVLDDFDIYAEAGGKDKGIMRSFQVTADSAINIDFGHVTADPVIKGIEILDRSTGGNGTTGTFAYDANGRAASVAWTGPGSTSITLDAVTARDLAGRITDQSIDGVDPYPTGANYVYDGAGRLTTARIDGHAYTYNYAAANPSNCSGVASLLATGKNTNRTSMVDTPTVGSPTTWEYCYDNADRLTKSSDTAVGTPAYDDHGNATTMFGEIRGYDWANRHLSSESGTDTVTYVRDATDRIVERKLNGSTVARYSSSGSGDTPSLTLDAGNNVVEQTLVLPGGVMITARAGAGNVWSYPNLHGDYIASADHFGAKQGMTATFDPYGDLTSGAVADNSAGEMDYGWLGQHQRPLEQQSGLEPTIEMGARQYSPRLGRFIEQDPVEGGSANDYDYANGDPINRSDVSGKCPECAMLALISALIETQRKGFMRFEDSIKIIQETQTRSDAMAREARRVHPQAQTRRIDGSVPSPSKIGNSSTTNPMPTNEMINGSAGYAGPAIDGLQIGVQWDTVSAIALFVGSAAPDCAAGATMGGISGSFIPILGTSAGAVIGCGVGAAGGKIAPGWSPSG